MSDQQATPNDKGPAPVTIGPSGTTEPVFMLVPTSEVKAEDVCSVAVHYVDGVPELVVTGGNWFPETLSVKDASGSMIAIYTVGAVPSASRRLSGSMISGAIDYVYPNAVVISTPLTGEQDR
ncbi:hypothetical protein ACFWF7_37835 [Nocardia sp. NPDC060256]|uniref:hypothetical protein n=1 Tax=unclassified Nocardia TaxID=2637762 RepID=UPI0036627812